MLRTLSSSVASRRCAASAVSVSFANSSRMASAAAVFAASLSLLQRELFRKAPNAACGTLRSKPRYMPMVTISPLFRTMVFMSPSKVKYFSGSAPVR